MAIDTIEKVNTKMHITTKISSGQVVTHVLFLIKAVALPSPWRYGSP